MPLLQKLVGCAHEKLYQIYKHPFNKQLFKGTLPPKIFNDFLMNDRIYLRSFAHALALLSTRIPNREHGEKFSYLSTRMLQTERKILEKYLINKPTFSFFHLPFEPITAVTKYSHHLLSSTTNDPVGIAITSCLPCFWIYAKLGEMGSLQALPENHPYKEWIQTYSSASFKFATNEIVNIFEDYAGLYTDPYTTNIIVERFCASVQYELDIFDEVYYPHRIICDKHEESTHKNLILKN